MSEISPNRGQKLIALRLILCLGSLPLLVGVTGCASNRYTQSAAERQSATQRKDDHYTSYRVGAALASDGQYQSLTGVKVRTCKGEVELSGCVNTSALKDRAGDIARRVVCVREVRDSIIVKE
jgi:osmotically-inducible protein OsmY